MLFFLPFKKGDLSPYKGDKFILEGARRFTGDSEMRFQAKYVPGTNVFTAEQDSLEGWLTEHYCRQSGGISCSGGTYIIKSGDCRGPMRKSIRSSLCLYSRKLS
ncbi:hypothetical protein D1970_08580 [Mesobacillus zeae]|uniref:Uncharacterized protein n=1 Tax=Mesobacillus zeae TaxID=1917180 RepID=A0A398B7Z1_9BACI|nr:hypothetical protein D1970_08580 [Mesobacillus zeae]